MVKADGWPLSLCTFSICTKELFVGFKNYNTLIADRFSSGFVFKWFSSRAILSYIKTLFKTVSWDYKYQEGKIPIYSLWWVNSFRAGSEYKIRKML